jgi:hypothetical protein
MGTNNSTYHIKYRSASSSCSVLRSSATGFFSDLTHLDQSSQQTTQRSSCPSKRTTNSLLSLPTKRGGQQMCALRVRGSSATCQQARPESRPAAPIRTLPAPNQPYTCACTCRQQQAVCRGPPADHSSGEQQQVRGRASVATNTHASSPLLLPCMHTQTE